MKNVEYLDMGSIFTRKNTYLYQEKKEVINKQIVSKI